MLKISRFLRYLLAIGLLLALLGLSRDFGATWDEPQQRQKAHHLLDYWSGRSSSLPVPIDGAHLYGAPFDVVSAALERLTHLDPYVIRHAVNATVGWNAILLTAVLGARLFSPAVGMLSAILLTVNPRFFADVMNNPKDLPFAAAGTAVLLLMTRVRTAPPFVDARTAALLALVLGIALNIRPGALLFVGYLVVFIGYRVVMARAFDVATLVPVAARIGGVLAGALALGWVAWPWAYDQPLLAPFRAMALLSHFPWGGQVLFDGQSVPGIALPDSYVPRWLWLALPPVFLAGALASLALVRNVESRDRVIALWAAVVFPIVFVVGTRATLYDGIRHLLFVVPPLTILAAAGWWGLLQARAPLTRTVIGVLLAAGIAEPLVFQLRNHPNQIAYIQPLAGGPNAAFARYDLDYWGNCLLAAMTSAASREGQAPIAITGWPLLVLEANATRVPGVRLVGESDPAAVYDVRLARGTNDELLALNADPSVVERVTTADGALLCAVRAVGAE